MSASEDDTQAQLRKSNAANVRNQATILEQAEDALLILRAALFEAQADVVKYNSSWSAWNVFASNPHQEKAKKAAQAVTEGEQRLEEARTALAEAQRKQQELEASAEELAHDFEEPPAVQDARVLAQVKDLANQVQRLAKVLQDDIASIPTDDLIEPSEFVNHIAALQAGRLKLANDILTALRGLQDTASGLFEVEPGKTQLARAEQAYNAANDVLLPISRRATAAPTHQETATFIQSEIRAANNEITKHLASIASLVSQITPDSDKNVAASALQVIEQDIDAAQTRLNQAVAMSDSASGMLSDDEGQNIYAAIAMARANLNEALAAVDKAEDVIDQNSPEVEFREAREYVSSSDDLFNLIEDLESLGDDLETRIHALNESHEVVGNRKVDGQGIPDQIYHIERDFSEATKLLKQLTEQRDATVLIADDKVKLGGRIDMEEARLTEQLSNIAEYVEELSDVVTQESADVLEIEDLDTNADADDVDAAVKKCREAAENMEAAFKLIKAIAERTDASPETVKAKALLPDVQHERDNAHAAYAPVAADYYSTQVGSILDELDFGSQATATDAIDKLKIMTSIMDRAEEALNNVTFAIKTLPDGAQKDELRKFEVEAASKIDVMKAKVNDFARAVTAHQEADPGLTAPPATPQLPPEHNVLIKRNGALADFTDTIVRSGQPDTDAPRASSASPTGGNNISYSQPSDIYYEGVKLNKGDYVKSVAHFGSGKKAVLQQDHTGRVTDASPGGLSPAEQGLKAMRMAEMLISNYTPSKGDIIIRGQDPVMANRVYAAVLLLKESHPMLKNAKIKSFVAGCEGPGTFTTNNSFIQKHLGEGVSTVLQAQAVGEMASGAAVRFKFINHLNSLKEEKLEAMRFREGDEIRLDESIDLVDNIKRAPPK